MDCPDTRGALVSNVQAGSRRKGGLERMDVIREFNGIMIQNATDLAAVGAPGSRFACEVNVMRDASRASSPWLLSELDADPSSPASASRLRPTQSLGHRRR